MKVDRMVPKVYYEESRDFSYIGRVLEVVFNYMKTASDSVAINEDNKNVDSLLIDLALTTLGFESKHDYSTKDLVAILSVFQTLIKKKGSEEAIRLAINTLLTSQKIENEAIISRNYDPTTGIGDRNEYIIQVPKDMTNIVLFEDLLDYILPTGIIYSIITTDMSQNQLTTTSDIQNEVVNIVYKDENVGQIAKLSNSEDDGNTNVWPDTDNPVETIDNRSMFSTGAVVVTLGDDLNSQN